jgi:hypothetical protein
MQYNAELLPKLIEINDLFQLYNSRHAYNAELLPKLSEINDLFQLYNNRHAVAAVQCKITTKID